MKTEKTSFFHKWGSFMKPYGKGYATSVLLSILSVVTGIVTYGCVGKIATLLFSRHTIFGKLVGFAVAAAMCELLSAVLLNLSIWISHKVAYHTLRDIRDALSDKILRRPMGYFEENGSGRLKTLLVDHVKDMEKTLAHMLPELTANLLAPMCCVLLMFFLV